MQQKIIPNLWFNGNAKEAVDFYTSVFPGGKTLTANYYPTEGLADFQKDLAGKELTIEFELGGQRFLAINAGPEFTPNQAISFMVNFDPASDSQARDNLDKLWNSLLEGGQALMPLDEYPFSKRYGWVQDRYGVSWQLILTNPDGEPRPFIMPALMFGGPNVNRAEEAIQFYLSVFKDSQLGTVVRYEADTGPAKQGSLMFADLQLAGQWFVAMDSGAEQDFTFTEGVSLLVDCSDQAEIDYYWDKLSSVPEAEQCGWCKDRYGVSWQVAPTGLDKIIQQPEAFAKMMEMKKIVLADFEAPNATETPGDRPN